MPKPTPSSTNNNTESAENKDPGLVEKSTASASNSLQAGLKQVVIEGATELAADGVMVAVNTVAPELAPLSGTLKPYLKEQIRPYVEQSVDKGMSSENSIDRAESPNHSPLLFGREHSPGSHTWSTQSLQQKNVASPGATPPTKHLPPTLKPPSLKPQ